MSNSRENDLAQPKMTVLIKETRPGEGICGHASVVTEDGRGNRVVTSMEPGAGGLLNITSFPIRGVNAINPEADYSEATHIFERPLTLEEHAAAVSKQTKINDQIDTGKRLYSFTGDNSVTRFFKALHPSNLAQSLRASFQTQQNVRNETGLDPMLVDGDPFASMDTLDVEDRSPVNNRKYPSELPKTKLSNCVSTTLSVIGQVDDTVPKSNSFTTPSGVAEILRKNSLFTCQSPLTQSRSVKLTESQQANVHTSYEL